MLELYTVPPGRLMAFGVEAFGRLWKGPLCTSADEFASKMDAAGVARDTKLVAWASIVAENLLKAGQMDPPRKCRVHHFFCSKDEVGRAKDESSAAGSAGDKCGDQQSPGAAPCCQARMVPSLSEVGLLLQLTNPCDKDANCFAARYDGQEHAISLDNDCLKGGANAYTELNKCLFYDPELRDHFIKRLDHLRTLHPTTASPVLAAVQESMGAQIEAELGPAVRRLMFSRIADNIHKTGEPSGPPKWWADSLYDRDPEDVSPIDKTAAKIYATFKSCQGGYPGPTDQGEM